jgi:hypothetical protein
MVGTGLRPNHQSRVDWWRGQFQRQSKANLSVTEFCLSVTTREGTTVPVTGAPVCNLWVAVDWYPPMWLGRLG